MHEWHLFNLTGDFIPASFTFSFDPAKDGAEGNYATALAACGNCNRHFDIIVDASLRRIEFPWIAPEFTVTLTGNPQGIKVQCRGRCHVEPGPEPE